MNAETFCKTEILPRFPLPVGEICWQGDSELDVDSYIYYFSIGLKNYLLLHEGMAEATCELQDNAIAPHEIAIPIKPINNKYSNIYIDSSANMSGYFSLFEIRRNL